MRYDFNVLERRAQQLLEQDRPQDAIKIYFFMADGDRSLDGGHLAERIAWCYERMNDLHAAKYWYGRAVEENPHGRLDCTEARKRLEHINIDGIIPSQKYIVPNGGF
jgi:hypothetical protein